MDWDVHGDNREPLALKFGYFVNCKEVCVFMERVVGNIWWCGEDSAKNSGSKHLNFVGIGENFAGSQSSIPKDRISVLVTFCTK